MMQSTMPKLRTASLFLALALAAFAACAALGVQAADAKSLEVGTQATTRTVNVTTSWTGAQIKSELETQKSASGTLVMNFEKGTYSLSKQLRVYSNTTIKLNGATLKNDSGQAMVRFGDNTKSESTFVKGYDGMHDIVIEGGTFDGAKADNALLHFSHAKNVTLKDMTFKNVKNAHLVELAGCQNVTVANCQFSNTSGTGSALNAEALQIDVCHKKHFADGAYDSTPTKDVSITGCSFTDVQRGVGTHSNLTGSYHENIIISNNTFSNIPGYAIMATFYTNSAISNNKISNCAAGIMFRTVGETFYPGASSTIVSKMNTVIENNVIEVTTLSYSTTSYGIQVFGQNLKKANKNGVKGDYRIAGITVKSNQVTLKDNGYGIWVQGSKGTTVSDNTVSVKVPKSGDKKGNGDGIRVVDSQSVKLTGNTISHGARNSRCANACGIVLNSSKKITISNNKIKKSNKYGISVDKKSKATVTGNKITKSKRYGIFADKKSTATCKKNKVSGYGTYGIVAGDKSKVYAKASKYKNKVAGSSAKAYHQNPTGTLK